MSIDKLGFSSFIDTAKEYCPEFDDQQQKRIIPYGISFLDRMLLGIFPDDLVLIGAPSGIGKSELANQIAINATMSGKRVVPFALEATRGEWEVRAKFRLYMKAMIKDFGQSAIETLSNYTYLDFKSGGMKDLIRPYQDIVEHELQKLKAITVFYRGKDFGLHEFTRAFNSLDGKADLVIIDHLHYFDSTNENENKAFTEIMKKIRDLNQITGIPVVVIGHLRKPEAKKDRPIIGDLDSFHGTSNIVKIASTVILLAAGDQKSDHQFQTYFRVAKARGAGSASRYAGIGTFNTLVNEYESEFVLGKLIKNDKEFQVIRKDDAPKWYLARAKVGQRV